MEKKYDVTALGELLIDFTQNGMSEQGNPMFEANPGGAPCNVLSMLTRYDRKVAFIGKVGNDGFGMQLSQAISEQGIALDGLRYDDEVHTTLALVHTLENGDRDFSFYRNPGADINLNADEVDEDLIKSSRIFHFGTLSLTSEPVISATKRALEIAKENGCIITFDPNLREPLWDSLDDAWEAFDYGLKRCDYLKISDNEIQWFTGEEDYDRALDYIIENYPDIKLITLSMGPDGSRGLIGDNDITVPAFINKDTIETTGAGDCFCAGMINAILEYGFEGLDDKKTLAGVLAFSNASASLVTTRKGALRVMPTVDEVDRFIAEYSI